MAKIKLTKNELKKQKDSLKRFERYLPTLQLKKQQLQMVIRQVEHTRREKTDEQEQLSNELENWIAVFGENADIKNLIALGEIVTDTGNIAGVDIPVFKEITFKEERYDLFEKPLWVDKGISTLKYALSLFAEIKVLKEQVSLLGEELRITTQRVNLFEKVKIPEAREHIRTIRIYLGDQQTAAVVRGKIAKNNIVKVN